MNAGLEGMLAALCLLGPVFPASGIEPEKMEAVVYQLQSFAVTEYATVYSPPQAVEIHLIADTNNAFDPRTTLVYYWPLTREYFQSWEKLDEQVDGRLEILTGGRVVQRLEREPVVFSYPRAAAEGSCILLAGAKAREAFAAYQKVTAEYEKEMAAYQQALLRYQQDLRDYIRLSSRKNGAAHVAELPPKEPAPPQPANWFVSDPRQMYIVRLPEGRYAGRVIDERGDLIEGSERTIVTFRPAERKGIGYAIIPEERWTARMQSDASQDALYSMPGKEIFVIPSVTETYREDLLVRLKNPQSRDSVQRLESIHTGPLDARRLVLLRNGRPVRTIERTPYYVRQAEGAELGYSIVEWSRESAGADSPTFTAFRLRFDEADAGSSYSITVEDPATAVAAAGSERRIRIVRSSSSGYLWLLSLAPLVAGACIVGWRKTRA